LQQHADSYAPNMPRQKRGEERLMNSIIKTHTGWVRQVNQDAGIIKHLDHDRLLVIVADGMGGHQAGEVASQMATQIIQEEVEAKWGTLAWEELLSQAVKQANVKIYERSKQSFELDGMGTTVIVGILGADQGLIAHVGDSRVYLSHASGFRQLTDDHSFVNILYKSGQITSEEARNHPQKNMLLRAVGTEAEIEVDLIPFAWSNGDRILFCTDGFSNHVSTERIADYLAAQKSVAQLGEEMLETALQLGGDDNITLVLVENARASAAGGDGRE